MVLAAVAVVLLLAVFGFAKKSSQPSIGETAYPTIQVQVGESGQKPNGASVSNGSVDQELQNLENTVNEDSTDTPGQLSLE